MKNFSPIAEFILDRLLEATYEKTLDSYRVRVNSIYTLMEELTLVLEDLELGKIKVFDNTVKPLIEELIGFVNREHPVYSVIEFKRVTNGHYKNLLNKAAKDNYKQLEYATKLLLADNKDYIQRVLIAINNLVIDIEADAEIDHSKLNILDNLLLTTLTHLLGKGYSKRYLHRIIIKYIEDAKQEDFNVFWERFERLFISEKEEFKVVFSIRLDRSIHLQNLPHVLSEEDAKMISGYNNFALSFISKKGNNNFIAFDVLAMDYLSAIKPARERLSIMLDVLNLGYNSPFIELNEYALVIGSREPQKTNRRHIGHSVDGSYKAEKELYEALLKKIELVQAKQNVQQEAKQRLVSGIRYLRLGDEASELQQKFMNYWIGLEYIFSSYNGSKSTIDRLKEFLCYIHCKVYLKRNLKEFHEDIKRSKIDVSEIVDFSDDLSYMLNKDNFQVLANKEDEVLLIAYRAKKFIERVFSKKGIEEILSLHDKILKQHLTRC